MLKEIVDWFCKKTGLRNDFACWRPPSPVSDVVSLYIVRKDKYGILRSYSLEGEEAKKWGQLLIECRGDFHRFRELTWKVDKVL